MKTLALLISILIFSGFSAAQTKGPVEAYRHHLTVCNAGKVEECKKTMTVGSLEMLADQAKSEGKTLDVLIAELKSDAQMPELQLVTIEKDQAAIRLQVPGTDQKFPVLMKLESGEWKVALDELAKVLAELFESLSKSMDEVTDGEKKDIDSSPTAKPKFPPAAANPPSPDSGSEEAKIAETTKPQLGSGRGRVSKCSISTKNSTAEAGGFDVDKAFEREVEFRSTNDPKRHAAIGTKFSVSKVAELAKFRNRTLNEYIETRSPIILDVFKNENPRLEVTCNDGNRSYYRVFNSENGRWIDLLAIKVDGEWKVGLHELVEEIVNETMKNLE